MGVGTKVERGILRVVIIHLDTGLATYGGFKIFLKFS